MRYEVVLAPDAATAFRFIASSEDATRHSAALAFTEASTRPEADVWVH